MSLTLREVKYSTFPYVVSDHKQEIAMFKNAGEAKLFVQALVTQRFVCEHKDTFRGHYELGVTKIRKRGNRQSVKKPKVVELADGGMVFCRNCPALSLFRDPTRWHEDIEAFLKHCVEG